MRHTVRSSAGARRNARLLPPALAAFLLLAPAPPAHAGSQTFGYTGGSQTFTVPAGVTSATFDVGGAQGGSQGGARGAKVVATFAVTPGEIFQIFVGGGGTPNGVATFNGGGSAPEGAGSGGGASDVRRGPCASFGTCSLPAQVVVAGGGGGGEQCGNPSDGVGGENGSAGRTYGGGGGGGATQAAGGAGGAPGAGAVAGTAGSRAQGGNGGLPGSTPAPGCRGSGGGGGYYGGGGGGGGGHSNADFRGGSGGGGSSFGPAGTVYTSGGGPAKSSGLVGADGAVTITWLVNTSTSVTSSANPSFVGDSVTYTATVSSASGSGTPSGSVDFTEGGSTISGCAARPVDAAGKATCTTSYASSGSHSIGASYGGDGSFASSSGSLPTQTVNRRDTTTSVSSSANPSFVGDSVTYTATVSPSGGSNTPTGSVEFSEDGNPISGCEARSVDGSGRATCTTSYSSAGNRAISAGYGGSSAFNTSTGSLPTQTVNRHSTTTALSAGSNPAFVGESVTFTAAVTSSTGSGTPGGTVAFTQDGSTIPGCGSQAVDGAGRATCTTSYASAGDRDISAGYGGDAKFLPSTDDLPTLEVNRRASATSLSSSSNPSIAGEEVTYTATVAASGGSFTPSGTVAFTEGGTTISGCGSEPVDASGKATCTTSYPTAGDRAIDADYAGDAKFLPSSDKLSKQEVNRRRTDTALSSSANPSTAGDEVTYTATVTPSGGSANPGGTVAFTEDGAGISGCGSRPLNSSGKATCTTTHDAAGSRAIRATYSGDAAFATSAGELPTQTVSERPRAQEPEPVTRTPRVAISHRVVPLRAGRLELKLRCSAAAGSVCAGRLSVAATGRDSRLGPAGAGTAVSVAAGKTRTFRIRPPAKALARLERTRKAVVRVTVSLDGAPRAQVFSKLVTVIDTAGRR